MAKYSSKMTSKPPKWNGDKIFISAAIILSEETRITLIKASWTEAFPQSLKFLNYDDLNYILSTKGGLNGQIGRFQIQQVSCLHLI